MTAWSKYLSKTIVEKQMVQLGHSQWDLIDTIHAKSSMLRIAVGYRNSCSVYNAQTVKFTQPLSLSLPHKPTQSRNACTLCRQNRAPSEPKSVRWQQRQRWRWRRYEERMSKSHQFIFESVHKHIPKIVHVLLQKHTRSAILRSSVSIFRFCRLASSVVVFVVVVVE